MVDQEATVQNGMPPQPSQFRRSHREGVPTNCLRLLLLTWNFPPSNAISSVRTWNIAKYLSRLSWDVTVVTPHPSAWRHVDNPKGADACLKKEQIRLITTDHRWRCLAPYDLKCWNQGLGWFAGGVCRMIARRLGIDTAIGWLKAAERTCSTLTSKDVDIILASGPPSAPFMLAKRLSDRLGRPYVLDYRDPWTISDPHADRPAQPAAIREETKLIKASAAVTIVSPSWGMALRRHFALGPKLHVVTNGYDPEDLQTVKPYDFGHFAIVYTGIFYPPERVISPMMAALKRFKETVGGKDGQWYFHYYGEQTNHVREEAMRFGVTEQVVLHARVPRAEALSAVRGAGVAVVIISVAEEATTEIKGMVTGKIFEALGLRTPVLLIAPSSCDIETVVETTGLARRFTGSDIDGIVSFLRDAMCGRVPKPRYPEAYAWTNIANKLDTVLRKVAASEPCTRETAN